MKSEHKREIIQLWWVAEQCFELAEQTKKNLKKKGLQTTVQQLADNCQQISDIKGTNEQLVLLNAHLASCAVRLGSIDERLGHNLSKRRRLYRELEKKCCLLKQKDVRNNLDKIVHFLLRHNVAHEEYHSKKPAHKMLQDTFMKLRIQQLYDSMNQVRYKMEKELKSKSIL